MELFRIEPGLILWTWISFAILLFIMSKFVFPALVGNVMEREDKISKAVDDAEVIKRTREDIENERAAVMLKARTDGDEILRRVREDGDLLKKKMAEKAELNAAEMMELARKKRAEEKLIAMQQMKAELAEFVCDASEKVIGRSFVPDEDRKWTMELADQL